MTASPTCLVLGGRGFVGSAIVRAAPAWGWTATPAGREDVPGLTGSSWDLIINANGNSKKYLSDRDPAGDFDASVTSVARSLHHVTAKRYVFLSTVDVYPDTSNPAHNHETAPILPEHLSRYGHHKWLAEELVKFNAASWLILRMAGFVGTGLKKNPVYDLLTGTRLRVHPDSAYQYQNTSTLADTVFDLVHRGLDRTVINVAGDGLITPREIAALIPDRHLSEPDPTLKPEHYEINIETLKSIRNVPATRDIVTAFVQDVLAGKETLT